MKGCKYLIVNADDFGMSLGVNEGVFEAFEKGVLTSASLMVRGPEARAAANYARNNPILSIGLHLDLGEWVLTGEGWRQSDAVVALDHPVALAAEIEIQLCTFRDLMGTDPTHLDSHQHVHRRDPVRSILASTAYKLGVELRHCSSAIRYCGRFYGQSKSGYLYPEGI